MFRYSSGRITLSGPPEVKFLGAITDAWLSGQEVGIPDDVIAWSDAIFQPNDVAAILQAAPFRRVEESGNSKDRISFSADRRSVDFSFGTASGADDVRLIIDYGNQCTGAAGFPAGVSFDIKLKDDITTTKGIVIGSQEYGEAVELKGVPLTATGADVRVQAPVRLPDVQCPRHQRRMGR